MSEININELTAEQIKQFNPTLYEKIRNDVDPNAEIETLKDQLEAEKTTNKELSDDNDKLREGEKDIKKENEDLKKENDEFKAEKAIAEKKVKVDELLKEAELPKELVTDFFKESLLKLDEEGMQKAIEERKAIAESTKGKVTDSGEEFKPGEDKDGKIDDQTKADVIESAKSR